jgi:DNA-binding NarL/FixJ family response regulator
MPVMNGLEATAKIKEKLPQSKIVILSMYEKQQYIDEALQNGASGYVLKDTAGAELIKAIDYINGGGTYLSPLIASKLTKQYINLRSRKDVSTKVSRLTDRETEVLKLLALGKTNKEISEELYISVKTVETHRKNMMSKLELRNLADVVRFALKEGIISL